MSQHRTHIVSQTPQRTRLRVSPKRRNHEEMARIAKALETCPAIHEVRTNIQTGSIVIQHSHQPDSFDNIVAILNELGIILGSVTGVEMPSINNGKSQVAHDLTSAIADLNKQVGSVTNDLFDLRVLMPMGLASLALYQLLRKGWQFETVPWYVLAWYAFDSFIKLHYTADPSTKQQSDNQHYQN